jgi:uncharacterized protein YqjF (DUF2071 family)
MSATFLTARWLDVAALTYRVDPGLVQPYLPHGVEADLEDGAAQVSLVAFSFCDTSLGGLLPAPLHQRFAEVNFSAAPSGRSPSCVSTCRSVW